MTHPLLGYEAAHQPSGLTVRRRSPRGLLALRGADRDSFLQGQVSNDVASLTPGETRHAALLDTTGHILADLFVHAFLDSLVVETDPACFPTLHQTLDKFLIMEDVALSDVSEQWVILSVLGDGAAALLLQLPDVLAAAVRPLTSPLSPGFDLWLRPAAEAAALTHLAEAGAVPLGEDAAETLRVEAGCPAWGRELTPSVLLPEAGMVDAVSYTKGCYVGQEIVARLHARGHTNRALCHVLLAANAPVPPPGTTLNVPQDGLEPGREVGRVTSAVHSPRRGGQALALAYVRREYLEEGTPVSVQITQPGGLVFSHAGEVRSLPGR